MTNKQNIVPDVVYDLVASQHEYVINYQGMEMKIWLWIWIL